jgi:hypothetical protein
MNPNFLNLFIKKLTRERVVPTISANVSWLNLGIATSGLSFFAEVSKQQKNPGQSLFAGIEELVH